MENVPDFERNGIKVLGKKSVAVYFGSWWQRKPSISCQFYDVYFYIFITQRYSYNGKDILCGIKHIVFISKKWVFMISISQSSAY